MYQKRILSSEISSRQIRLHLEESHLLIKSKKFYSPKRSPRNSMIISKTSPNSKASPLVTKEAFQSWGEILGMKYIFNAMWESLSRISHQNDFNFLFLSSTVSETWSDAGGREGKFQNFSYTRNFFSLLRWDEKKERKTTGKNATRKIFSSSFNFSFSLFSSAFHIGIRPSVVLYIVHRSKIIHFNGVVWCCCEGKFRSLNVADEGKPSRKELSEMNAVLTLMENSCEFKIEKTFRMKLKIFWAAARTSLPYNPTSRRIHSVFSFSAFVNTLGRSVEEKKYLEKFW